ncbi:phage head closure protein [Halomonas elongata]|uniref:phage head closure protein n=1 Tax=Halomonas elongata TaxID=2746 RepID=UPI00186B8595|nr:phage head closure protein [Halomonas elongata]MBW5800065.1 phage head closure protein [Halomonas elongata]
MQAGKLRHRITLQRYEDQKQGPSGELIGRWIDVATVWASIEALSAREFIAAQSTQSEITVRITIRYRPGLDATMRAVHDGAIYNIHGVLPDPRSRRHYLTLPVSEGVTDG